MQKLHVLLIAGIFLLCMAMSGCGSGEPAIDRELDFAREKPEEGQLPGNGNTGGTKIDLGFPDVGLDPTQIYEAHEEVRIAGFVFSDFKMLSIDERLPDGVAKDSVYYLYDNPVDKDSTLQDGNQYVFAEISIRNESDEEKTYTFFTGFIIVDSQLHLIEQDGFFGELCYNSENPDPAARDFGGVKLAPKATKRVMFGYIMNPDVMKQGSLYFSVYEGGFFETMKYQPYTVYKAS